MTRLAKLVAALGFLFPLLTFAPAFGQSTFGTLSNFDVFNTTGEDCHGFEIELDGISSADVTYKFGKPYERYGDPQVVPFAGGVYIRYESPYDPVKKTFTESTPQAPAVITPTGGHACWTGGSASYPTSGCEHFGVGVIGSPTKTAYHWLVDDPAKPGSLKYSSTKVTIPAPSWSVAPPAAGGGQPVVAAAVQAEAPEAFQFGDAQWVKVYKSDNPKPVKLNHLLTDDRSVPQSASEVETEWFLSQASNVAGAGELDSQDSPAPGDESVTRRYEFYQYTGAYDPESHEALPVNDSNPVATDIGNYVGAQMAAINLGAPLKVTVNGAGSVSGDAINCGVECSETVAAGTKVKLVATPGAGYRFAGWSGACKGTRATCSVEVDAETSVTAKFAKRRR